MLRTQIVWLQTIHNLYNLFLMKATILLTDNLEFSNGLPYIVFTTSLWDRCYYYPCFMKEETAKEMRLLDLIHISQLLVGPGFKSDHCVSVTPCQEQKCNNNVVHNFKNLVIVQRFRKFIWNHNRSQITVGTLRKNKVGVSYYLTSKYTIKP